MSRNPWCAPLMVSALLATTLSGTSLQASASAQNSDGSWSSLDTLIAAPSARREYSAIYDEGHDRYLLFGGFGFGSTSPEGLFNEVWAMTLGSSQTWALLDIAGNPPGPRKMVQWGYDIARQRVLIFGGYGEHHPGDVIEYLNDVWQLSLDGTPTWTELFPTGTPPVGRLAGAAVYDPLRQRFVGFGGDRGLPVDTWSLDLSGEPAWTPLDTGAQSPPGSYGMTSIYDAVRDRMLIFGGSLTADYYGVKNDIWELTLGDTMAWHPVVTLDSSAARPCPRRSHGAVYDPMRDRMVIYAGWDGYSNDAASWLSDTWVLPLSGELHWQQLAPTGPVPIRRVSMAPIYDPIRDRMVVYGGWSVDTMLGDTEFLTWGDAPAAATMTATATAAAGTASLHWTVQNATGEHAAVYRRGPGQPWASIATVHSAAGGAISFVDNTVAAGANYTYQVAVSSHRGESFGGQVSVLIPGTTDVTPPPLTAPAFALNRVQPNPLVDRFNVSFALPDGQPAQIEVLDVAGRRVLAREVGSLGAGAHVVELGSAGAYEPGVYFVRLSRTGQTLTTRAVVVGGGR